MEEQDDFSSKRIVYAIPAMEETVVLKDITFPNEVFEECFSHPIFHPSNENGKALIFCSQSLVIEAPLRNAALVWEVTHGHGSSTLSTIVHIFRCCDDWFMLIDRRRSL